MNGEMLPCPFCGSQYLDFNSRPHELGAIFWVSCTECFADGPPGDGSKEEAVRLWNVRTFKATERGGEYEVGKTDHE